MAKEAHALLRTTNGRTFVHLISSKISVVKKRKKELEERQAKVTAYREMLNKAKVEFAKEWNRASDLPTTVEELNERNDKLWAWVNDRLSRHTPTLGIPDYLLAACNLGLPFVEYTYEVQSAEMV